LYRAIADPTRRRVIELLLRGERPVGDVIATIRLKPPAASYHLRVLTAAGLLRQRRRSTQRLYRVETRALSEAHRWLGQCLAATHST
jgi:DNA-binding transcriptional ArsR family regulator